MLPQRSVTCRRTPSFSSPTFSEIVLAPDVSNVMMTTTFLKSIVRPLAHP
jgi:hypothetical protein